VFVVERSGNQSVYGDLTISFTPHSGSEQVIARANGVAICTPKLRYMGFGEVSA